MIVAKSLAFDMSVEPTLSTKCCSFRKRQYGDNDNDKQIQSPRNHLESIIAFMVVDMTIVLLKISFEQFEVFKSIVELLFAARTLKSLEMMN